MFDTEVSASIAVKEKSSYLDEGWKRINTIDERIKQEGLKGDLIVGGGLVYESEKYEREPVRDLDTMFLFETRQEMEAYFTSASDETLSRSFGFDADTVDKFTGEEKKFAIENGIEIIRISGKIDGIKTTVKLTDKQTLQSEGVNNERRVFSKKKDKRIYERLDAYGNSVQMLLQNVTVSTPDSTETSYVILDKDYFQVGDTIMPGLITDFLVSSRSADTTSSAFGELQDKQRDKFVQTLSRGKSDTRDWSHNLIRGKRFSAQYKERINTDLNSRITNTDPSALISSKPIQEEFVYVVMDSIPSPEMILPEFSYIAPDKKPRCESVPNSEMVKARVAEAIEITTGSHVYNVNTYGDSKFNSNGLAGQAVDEGGRKYFFKIPTPSNLGGPQYEVQSIKNIRQLYTHINPPLCWTEDYSVVITPWIEDYDLEALKIIGVPSMQRRDIEILEVLNTELVRTEEMRKAYQASLTEVQSVPTEGERVHNLHFNRLVGERYSSYFEGKAVTLPDGTPLSFEQFSQMTPVINGARCESFQTILSRAKDTLNPANLNNHAKVYGFGDNHAANVLITHHQGEDYYVETQNERMDYTTIDYEFSGVQPPEVDIAKTVYNDVFGRTTIYREEKLDGQVQVRVEGNEVHIDYNEQLNTLEKELLEIKLRGVLFPTLDHAKEQGLDVNNWEEILRSSLVTSALLNKNVLEYENPRTWYALAQTAQIGTVGANPTETQFILDKLISEYKVAALVKEIPQETNKIAEYLDPRIPLKTLVERDHLSRTRKDHASVRLLDELVSQRGIDATVAEIDHLSKSGAIDKATEASALESIFLLPEMQNKERRSQVVQQLSNGREVESELKTFWNSLNEIQPDGVELGHMMIKPEGLKDFSESIQAKIELELTSAGLEYVIFPSQLDAFQARRMYTEKHIPDAYIQNLSENQTMQILVRGPHANEIIKKIRGKMVDASKITSDMTADQISGLPGTGIRGQIKEASEKSGGQQEKWQNFIHGSETSEEALRFALYY